MATTELVRFFEERHAEVEEYLSFLRNLETAAQEGVPRLRGTDVQITTAQTKILYSSLYLQLYNLVEASIVRCLEEVAAATKKAKCRPSDLSTELRTEWVRSIARTHDDLGPEKRLQAALTMCEQLLGQAPVKGFKIDHGGGGNWDEDSIRKLSKRVGCTLTIPEDVFQAAKRHIRDDMGALKLVKDRRNRLAHGSLSFVDCCGETVTVNELKEVADAVGNYLREAVDCFDRFIKREITDKNNQTGKQEAFIS